MDMIVGLFFLFVPAMMVGIFSENPYAGFGWKTDVDGIKKVQKQRARKQQDIILRKG